MILRSNAGKSEKYHSDSKNLRSIITVGTICQTPALNLMKLRK